MPTNTNEIQKILDRRLGRGQFEGKGRLQKIEAQEERLKGVNETVNNFYKLVSEIQEQYDKQQGEYYKILASDPEAKRYFDEVRLFRVQGRFDAVFTELEKLKARFSRQTLRIAFIGVERQGKSTFLKTITGLSDKVIPAYSGNSCTGAVSVIHNVDTPLRVDVEYYTVEEFLKTVNDKLKRYFPGQNLFVTNLMGVANLQLPESLASGTSTKLGAEYYKFKDAYVGHFNDYRQLLGSGVVPYNDENEIARHVAQYEEFDEPVDGSYETQKDDSTVKFRINYYKYIAVKSVNIYTPFQVADTKLLELVDTIGIGSAADSEEVENEMFRVLRDDCDAAVDLFFPKDSSFPSTQTNLLDHISTRLKGRDPSKFIVYVVNKAVDGEFKNIAKVNDVLPQITQTLDSLSGSKPVAWVETVNGESLTEVTNLLVNPLLKLISENLDELDINLMENANRLAKAAYTDCLTLVKKAGSVISASSTRSANLVQLFQVLYAGMLKDFERSMIQLDELGYARQQDAPCEELEEEYDEILGNLSNFLPSTDTIFETFMTTAAATPDRVYEDYVEQMRNIIFTAFENVNETVLKPLQEKVKTDIIGILYEHAMMKRLPVKFSGKTPDTKWLQEIIDNYVDEKEFSSLYKALRFVLDYQINIEGLVEYNVTRSLYIIDRTKKEFMRYEGEYPEKFEDKAQAVWDEMSNCIMPIIQRMRAWIGDFALIPSHSFYSRVHKFHIRLMTDEGGINDLHKFYSKNMGLIWGDQIRDMVSKEHAFGDWAGRVKELRDVVKSDNFEIS